MAGIAVSTKAKVVTENNRAVVERAYQTIRDMILCHQVRLEENTSVARLADDIGIGRTPVKEAITRGLTAP
jgi:DNA-binding GntR family transcriptional regulator